MLLLQWCCGSLDRSLLVDPLNIPVLKDFICGGFLFLFLFNNALNTFSYRYVASDIWSRTIQIAREETRCWQMGYSFRLTARVLLYAPSHRQDSTCHSLCYTSHGALAGTRNSSMGPPHEGSTWWPVTPWVNSLTTELHHAPGAFVGVRSS